MLVGIVIQSHYVCCWLCISVPKERINKHHIIMPMFFLTAVIHSLRWLITQISANHVKACLICQTVSASAFSTKLLTVIILVFVFILCLILFCSALMSVVLHIQRKSMWHDATYLFAQTSSVSESTSSDTHSTYMKEIRDYLSKETKTVNRNFCGAPGVPTHFLY